MKQRETKKQIADRWRMRSTIYQREASQRGCPELYRERLQGYVECLNLCILDLEKQTKRGKK